MTSSSLSLEKSFGLERTGTYKAEMSPDPLRQSRESVGKVFVNNFVDEKLEKDLEYEKTLPRSQGDTPKIFWSGCHAEACSSVVSVDK